MLEGTTEAHLVPLPAPAGPSQTTQHRIVPRGVWDIPSEGDSTPSLVSVQGSVTAQGRSSASCPGGTSWASVPACSSGAMAGPHGAEPGPCSEPSLHTGTPRAEGPSQLGLLSRLSSPGSLSLCWARSCSRPFLSCAASAGPAPGAPWPCWAEEPELGTAPQRCLQGWAQGQDNP